MKSLKKNSFNRMKPPKLGKQSLLQDNHNRETSFSKFPEEIYDKQGDDNPMYTGRHLLILKEGAKSIARVTSFLKSEWALSVANTADFVTKPPNESNIKDADALVFNDLGIALLGIEDDRIKRLQVAKASADYIIEQEKVVYLPDDITVDTDIISAWGVEAIEALKSQYSGEGIKVAVLDTGFDTGHPDFEGRSITASSFVPDESINDFHGHGTHCIGTACGSVDQNGLRYGVATKSHIYAGKVLSNQGSGAQSWVLNGMTWAANGGCKVISMSLGSKVDPGQAYDIAYERAALFAQSKGAIVVAAAGNESRRSKNKFSPVGSPADCPSILAIAALDSKLNVADFSNRAINPTGLVDIAAPGVAIYSSWRMPVRYRTISGTSMATPHVAGIMALLFEKYPGATAQNIENEFRKLARNLPLSSEDVGDGLSIAP